MYIPCGPYSIYARRICCIHAAFSGSDRTLQAYNLCSFGNSSENQSKRFCFCRRMLAIQHVSREPDPIAFASFMDWIYVRNRITELRRYMPTNRIFQAMLQDSSFTGAQIKLTKALKLIYTKKKHKIYSPFAYEDPAVKLFHSNLQHCIDFRDVFGFWFVLLAFLTGTNREMMLLCQRVLMHDSSFIETWNSDGKQMFERAKDEVYKSCTRRGNLPLSKMRSMLTMAIDNLCNFSAAYLQNTYQSALQRQTCADDALHSMSSNVGLKSIGTFKVYFVSKMLNVFDSRFRFQSHAGPSVTLAADKSALNLLFPTICKLKTLDMEMLQVCISKSEMYLPADLVQRIKLDDMEHSACEWMRTLRYAKQLPLSPEFNASTPQRPSIPSSPKNLAVHTQKTNFFSKYAGMEYDNENKIENSQKHCIAGEHEHSTTKISQIASDAREAGNDNLVCSSKDHKTCREKLLDDGRTTIPIHEAQSTHCEECVAPETFTCQMCGQHKTPSSFWRTELSNRLQEKLHCKTCKPMPNNAQDLYKKIYKSALRHICCPMCKQEKMCLDFWPLDLVHKNRPNFGCKTCKPISPSERGRKHLLCRLCGKVKVRSDYWPGDLTHQSRREFGCKECKPLPPSQRRKRAGMERTEMPSNKLPGKQQKVDSSLSPKNKKKRDALSQRVTAAPATMDTISSDVLVNVD